MKAVFEVYEEWNRRVPTAQLNRWLAAAIAPIRRRWSTAGASSCAT